MTSRGRHLGCAPMSPTEGPDPSPCAASPAAGPAAPAVFGHGCLGELAVFAVQQLISVVGVDCRHLDAYSYGLVEVNALTDTATVTLKDDTGAPLHDQLDRRKVCRKTFGP